MSSLATRSPWQGGLCEGEPRQSPSAWATYQEWIQTGKMVAATTPHPVGTDRGYTAEWAISFELLAIGPGHSYRWACHPMRAGERPTCF